MTSLNPLSSPGTPPSQLIWQYIGYLFVLLLVICAGCYILFQAQWQIFISQQFQILSMIQVANNPEELLELPGESPPYTVVIQSVDGLRVSGSTENERSVLTRWYSRTIFNARHASSSSGITEDPDGKLWIYSTNTGLENQTYLILQPVSELMLDLIPWFGIFFIVAGIAAICPYIVWQLVKRRFISPLYQLSDMSEVIRWRGYLQNDERQQLIDIIETGHDTQILAQTLLAMEQEISKRFYQLSGLLSTSQIVVSSLDTEEVLNNILVEVQSFFGCDRCAIVTLDEARGTFRIQASRGLSPDYVQQLNITPSEPNSSSMRALRNQTPIQVVDVEMDLGYEALRERARRENFRSVLSIPLTTVHTPPSVLNLYKNEPYRYSYSERELAISFGNHASLALENATLFKESDEQLKVQTRRLISIIESMTEPLILEGANQELTYMNSQARRLPGLEGTETQNLANTIQKLKALITAAEDQQRYLQAYNQSGNTSIDVEVQFNGQMVKDIRVQFFDVRDSNQNYLGRGQVWQDVSKDKQIDRMKSSLVSTVSHELRTPLATIKGYVTSLLATDVSWDSKTQTQFLQTILVETNRLAQLVSNILDLSQIEAGLVNIKPELTLLNELVSIIFLSFPLEAQQRIMVTYDMQMPPIMLDVQRISTVIRNLIDNALKYAPDSPVEVLTQYDANQISLSVRDYGTGIVESEKDKIFERFYRSGHGLNRPEGGVGLGLAICKGFVEAHNGRIWLESDDNGTSFSFSLPVN